MTSVETKEQKFTGRPTPEQIKNAPTITEQSNLDEFKIIELVLKKENRPIFMPIISADQYAAFIAYLTQMRKFYDPADKLKMFEFFTDFIDKYQDALLAENGYSGELLARLLEAIKAAELKGPVSESQERRGWGHRFLGGH